jgi:hypothetical protein
MRNLNIPAGFPPNTPWDAPQTFRKIADGIAWYTTASHGGYWVSPELHATMPAEYKRCSWTGDNWFEEDASWCAVPLSFPQHFTAAELEDARKGYRYYDREPA